MSVPRRDAEYEAVMPPRSGWIHRWLVREAATGEFDQRPWLRVEAGQRFRVRLPPDWPPTYDDCAVVAAVVLDDGKRYLVAMHRMPEPPPPPPRRRMVLVK